MTTEAEDPVAASPSKKLSNDLLWKGLQVEVPGDVFYESGTKWKGVITGVSHKKSTAKKNAVYVKFDDDDKTYWFDKKKAIEWLTDKKIAEELRPTLTARKNRRSLSESESSICPDASHQSPDQLDAKEANGDGSHLSPLGKIPEAANGPIEATPEKKKEEDVGLSYHPAGEPAQEDDDVDVMQTPSTSVVRRFSKWMTGKFRSSRMSREEIEKEDVSLQVNVETDEEMLDNDELEKLGGTPDNGAAVTPVKLDDSRWFTKMADAFYTPFSSRKIRRRNLSPVERPRRSSNKDEELDAISNKVSSYRRSYEEGKLRFFEKYPDAHPTPENIRTHFASLRSDRPVPMQDLNHSYNDKHQDLDVRPKDTDQTNEAQWRPTHVAFMAAVLFAWGSCVYYGFWLKEEGESA